MNLQSKAMWHEHFFTVSIYFLVELIVIYSTYEPMFPNGKLENML